MFLARESAPPPKKIKKNPVEKGGMDKPSYTVDFWDIAWFKDGV